MYAPSVEVVALAFWYLCSRDSREKYCGAVGNPPVQAYRYWYLMEELVTKERKLMILADENSAQSKSADR